MQTKEQIMEMLTKHKVEFTETQFDKYDYSRHLTIKTFDNEITLEWWANIMYIFIGEIQIPFYSMDISSTWPNHFDVNINLCSRNKKDTLGIIPIRMKR